MAQPRNQTTPTPITPSAATTNGFHQWDAQLEDLSQPAVQRQVTALRRFEREIADFRGQAPDRDLLLSHIHSSLLALESIRMWEKNPDAYSSAASNGAFVIMSRNFAPPDARLESVI